MNDAEGTRLSHISVFGQSSWDALVAAIANRERQQSSEQSVPPVPASDSEQTGNI